MKILLLSNYSSDYCTYSWIPHILSHTHTRHIYTHTYILLHTYTLTRHDSTLISSCTEYRAPASREQHPNRARASPCTCLNYIYCYDFFVLVTFKLQAVPKVILYSTVLLNSKKYSLDIHQLSIHRSTHPSKDTKI